VNQSINHHLVVQLVGGLGNQLFQYAAARKIALAYNLNLKIDKITSYSNALSERIYGLSHFKIQGDLVNFHELEYIRKKGRYCRYGIKLISHFYKQSDKLNTLRLFCPGYLYLDEANVYDYLLGAKGRINKDIYLQGYFASEKYFIDIREIILEEVKSKSMYSAKTQLMAEQTRNSNSISLHVRRGDYVNKPSTSKVFASCTIEYYLKAIDIITKSIDKPHLYIFSDEPRWVKENMNFEYPTTYISHNTTNDYEDLFLMSQCKHNIIANSTFSWWGAWLNINPDKIVIAPKIWFKNLQDNNRINFSDLYPQQWIKI